MEAKLLERNVLAAVAVEPRCLVDLEAAGVTGEWFEQPAHKAVWEAWKELNGTDDPNLLVDRLRSAGMLEKAGGADAVLALYEAAPDIANLHVYVEDLRGELTRRRLKAFVAQAQAAAETPSGKIEAELAKLHRELSSVSGVRRDEVESIQALLAKSSADLDRRVARGGSGGLETGLSGLDQILGGLEPGDLCVLAARPSVGKTLLACQIAMSMAKTSPMLFFSLEMTKAQLVRRMLSSESGIQADRLRSGLMFDADWKHYEDACQALSELKLYIDENGDSTPDIMMAKALQIQKRVGLGAVMVDYLQLMGHDYDAVSINSKAMKHMAKSLGVPLVLLSQLSREGEKQGSKPNLTHLRGSGSIEQDADQVIMLHRDREKDGEADPNPTEVLIRKNRQGATGTLVLRTDLRRQRLVEMPRAAWHVEA